MPHLILALMNDALPVLPAPSPLQVGERVEIVERVRVERHPIDPEADDPGAAAAPTQRHRMVLRVAVARTETAAGEPRVVLDVTGGWIDTARGEREPHPLAGRSFVLGPGFDVLDPAVGPATPEPVERVVQLLAATMHEWAA
ncbi:MAG TPA: hypothetical protein PKA64_22640, partial [Myxococcota bacterium]|nr:hypothetical protein [Myxococcota bacterium]